MQILGSTTIFKFNRPNYILTKGIAERVNIGKLIQPKLVKPTTDEAEISDTAKVKQEESELSKLNALEKYFEENFESIESILSKDLSGKSNPSKEQAQALYDQALVLNTFLNKVQDLKSIKSRNSNPFFIDNNSKILEMTDQAIEFIDSARELTKDSPIEIDFNQGFNLLNKAQKAYDIIGADLHELVRLMGVLHENESDLDAKDQGRIRSEIIDKIKNLKSMIHGTKFGGELIFTQGFNKVIDFKDDNGENVKLNLYDDPETSRLDDDRYGDRLAYYYAREEGFIPNLDLEELADFLDEIYDEDAGILIADAKTRLTLGYFDRSTRGSRNYISEILSMMRAEMESKSRPTRVPYDAIVASFSDSYNQVA